MFIKSIYNYSYKNSKNSSYINSISIGLLEKCSSKLLCFLSLIAGVICHQVCSIYAKFFCFISSMTTHSFFIVFYFYYVSVFPGFIYVFPFHSKLLTFPVFYSIFEKTFKVAAIRIGYLTFAIPFVIYPRARKYMSIFLL